MAAKEELELFLSRFIQKVKVLGIVFRDDRGKNMQTLLEPEKCGYSEKSSAGVMCILRFQWA